MPGISVVINTLNEEKNIKRAIKSVKWADEILVCDMHSDDKTVEIAKKLGAKAVYHKRTNYVEPARNFAISKSSGDWIFILDADEEVPDSLGEKIREIAKKMKQIDFVEIPRKNIIFNKWMKTSGWWPDYQIRFFRKGKVLWQEQIHSRPKTDGQSLSLSPKEGIAIIHHNYQGIGQFIDRMNRYTTVEVEYLHKTGYKFKWTDLIEKPLNEFLSRFFANKGYQDGLHGLALGFLQAFSFLTVYLKVWEKERFDEQKFDIKELEQEKNRTGKTLDFWFKKESSNNFFSKLFRR